MPTKPKPPNSGGSGKFRSNPAIIAALVAAIGGVIAAVATGIFGLFGGSSAGSSPTVSGSSPSPTASSSIGTSTQECTGFRADVEIPSQVGPYPALTIDFNCAPAVGQHYLWVVEADGIGKDKHAEYYPKQFESGVQVGVPFTTSLDLHNDRIGEQNCIYVISVTTQQYENIESNLNGHNFTLQLPDGVARVSAPACETREQ